MNTRTRVRSVAYYYWGEIRPDPARRSEIDFTRNDPRHVDGARMRTYRNFTCATAQRVRRILEGGDVAHIDDRGRIVKWVLPRQEQVQ